MLCTQESEKKNKTSTPNPPLWMVIGWSLREIHGLRVWAHNFQSRGAIFRDRATSHQLEPSMKCWGRKRTLISRVYPSYSVPGFAPKFSSSIFFFFFPSIQAVNNSKLRRELLIRLVTWMCCFQKVNYRGMDRVREVDPSRKRSDTLTPVSEPISPVGLGASSFPSLLAWRGCRPKS